MLSGAGFRLSTVVMTENGLNAKVRNFVLVETPFRLEIPRSP